MTTKPTLPIAAGACPRRKATLGRQLACWLCGAGAALACGIAHADAAVDVAVQGLRITLVDLDPADGIAPSLVFESGDSGVRTTASKQFDIGQWTIRSADTLFAPVSVSSALPGGRAQVTASFSGDIYGGGTTMESVGTAVDGPVHGVGNAGQGDALIGLNSTPAWVLSPHTLLEVSGTVQASGSTTGPLMEDFATGLIDFQLSSAGANAQRQSYHRAFLADTWSGDIAFTDSFDLAISNTSAQNLSGAFSGFVSGSAQTGPLEAVPEPAGPLLAGAGLGLIALMGRRRQHR